MARTIAKDRRKGMRFGVVIDGFEVAFLKSFDPGEEAVNTTEHTQIKEDGTFAKVQTAASATYGDITLENYLPADGYDDYFDIWQLEVKTLPYNEYVRPVILQEYDANRVIIDEKEYQDCFPKTKKEGINDRDSDDNKSLSVTLANQGYTRI